MLPQCGAVPPRLISGVELVLDLLRSLLGTMGLHTLKDLHDLHMIMLGETRVSLIVSSR